MVQPRNIAAKLLMEPRTPASFLASAFGRYSSGTALDFHKVALQGQA